MARKHVQGTSADPRKTKPKALAPVQSAADQRRAIADFCRMYGQKIGALASRQTQGHNLSPREQQTLQLLLAGASEKEAAVKLGVSPNTVHVYVKRLYKHFDVSSRGELMARCLG